MKELQVTGKQEFMGKEIPVVLGGFGEDKKCISDKTIAEIHKQPEREIRRRITDNIKRFQESIDFIDLKQRVGESHTLNVLISLGYAKQSITQAEHIYILSERGYAKLIKIMDTDLAWRIHDKLIDEYFALREQVQEFKLPQTYLEALKALTAEVEKSEQLILENDKQKEEIKVLTPKAEFADKYIVSDHSITLKEFAAILTQNGYKIGQNNLFKKLQNDGYICKSGARYNLPKQNLIEAGYFEVDTHLYYDKYEEREKFTSRTMVTPKGQKYLMTKMLKETA